MPNRAAEELQNLIAMQGDAAQSQSNVQSIQNTRNPVHEMALKRAAENRDMEAGFSTPEAVATAVASGFILGPVGGILMGVAQGILGKQAKQNVLDQFAAENEVYGSVDEMLNGQFDRLAAAATNPNDLEQLATLQTQKDTAMKMLTSGSQKLQAQGESLLADMFGQLNEYTDLQETQKIAAEAYDAELKRALSQEQYDRFTNIKIRFDDDSQQYEDILGATNTAIQALQDGSPADLWAAGILVNKALDPTGIVRQEEAEAVGALGSLFTKGEVILQKALDGTTILPEERNNLMSLLTTIQGGAKQIQLSREARFLTELADAEVPQKYWDNFRLVDSVPAASAKAVPLDPSALQNAADATTVPVTDALEAIDNAIEADQLRFTNAMEFIFGLPGDEPPDLERLKENNPRARRALEGVPRRHRQTN